MNERAEARGYFRMMTICCCWVVESKEAGNQFFFHSSIRTVPRAKHNKYIPSNIILSICKVFLIKIIVFVGRGILINFLQIMKNEK